MEAVPTVKRLFWNNWVYFLLLLLLAVACKTETEIGPAELILTVKDNNGNLLNGATIMLFDNQLSYENNLLNVSEGTSIAQGVTSSGEVVFKNLDPAKQYFINATYKDQLSKIEFNNMDSTFRLLNKPVPNSKIYGAIVLAPSKSNFGFWTRSANNSKLPITVVIAGDSFILNNTLSAAPGSEGGNGFLTVNKNPGTYDYYAKNAQGCFWSGKIQLSQKTFKPLELQSCARGTVSFWTESFNDDILPITVVLNNADTIGKIAESRSAAPVYCTDTKLVSADREINSYNYYASSANGKYYWTGSFSINSDTCIVIGLSDYNK